MPGIGVIITCTVPVDISIIYCLKTEIFKPHPLFIQRHICVTRRDKEATSINKACDHVWNTEEIYFPLLGE